MCSCWKRNFILAPLAPLTMFSPIEYELIIPFQLQLKSLAHGISQKTCGQVFHSSEHKCVEKRKFVEKLFSFER